MRVFLLLLRSCALLLPLHLFRVTTTATTKAAATTAATEVTATKASNANVFNASVTLTSHKTRFAVCVYVCV